MNLDLHVHSSFSGDSPVRPEQYAERILEMKEAGMEIDGFALMEHNHLITPEECDLASLSRDTGLVILAGVEVDTRWGHLLVYGMTETLWARLRENQAGKPDPVRLARLAGEVGALCVPAHPFRFFIGMGERAKEIPGVCALEALNGSDQDRENRAAVMLAEKMGWAMTGGSDAHFLPELGNAVTRFENPVKTMNDLVREIKAGRVSPLSREEARKS